MISMYCIIVRHILLYMIFVVVKYRRSTKRRVMLKKHSVVFNSSQPPRKVRNTANGLSWYSLLTTQIDFRVLEMPNKERISTQRMLLYSGNCSISHCQKYLIGSIVSQDHI